MGQFSFAWAICLRDGARCKGFRAAVPSTRCQSLTTVTIGTDAVYQNTGRTGTATADRRIPDSGQANMLRRGSSREQTGGLLRTLRFPICELPDGDGSLRLMLRVAADCNRAIAAIFTMVIFYASACTTICALGVCPNHPQQTSSHDCESSTSDHSHRSSVPDKPDCSRHAHPSVVFVKSGGVARIDLRISAYLGPAVQFASPGNLSVANPTAFDGSDLAPPLAPRRIPLHQQIGVLRI